MERCSGGVHGLRRDEFGVSTGIESDMPSLAMDDDMMGLAQQAHPGQFRLAPVQPAQNMVGVAISGRTGAPGKAHPLSR